MYTYLTYDTRDGSGTGAGKSKGTGNNIETQPSSIKKYKHSIMGANPKEIPTRNKQICEQVQTKND